MVYNTVYEGKKLEVDDEKRTLKVNGELLTDYEPKLLDRLVKAIHDKDTGIN